MMRSAPRIPVLWLAASCVTAAACGEAPADSSVPAPSLAVRVERVTPEKLRSALSMPGIVESKSRISLAFRVTGFLERLHVEEGDHVEAGDVLAELDATDLERDVREGRAALERARAHSRNAELAFERQRRLRESDTASQRAYDEAESAYRMARAEALEARTRLERSEDRLAKATLRAPVAGYVERLLVEEHELATAETPVLILTELDVVTVRAAVADSMVSRLRVAGTAAVRSTQWPGRIFEGRIARIDVAADAATRTVPFEIELENPELALRPELVVQVEIPTGAPVSGILVPLAAVLRGADTRPFCFVAVDGEDGTRAERRPVSIGAVHGERVVVTDGLRPGESVVVRGQHFLRPGNPVRIVED